MSAQLTDDVGEPIVQKLNKALAEISNAREDVETGKHQSAILSFLRMAKEYVRAAVDDLHAVEASLASQLAQKAVGDERFDFEAHLHRQREWSERTFGPGPRAKGVVDHIRKELAEIEADPGDLNEWIDVVILALDGAWRSGAMPREIISALVAKQTRNEGRVWPDWRTADPDKAIEHDRSKDTPRPAVATPSDDIVTAVADAFLIGALARTKDVILANVENVIRRKRCLDAIEREFFTHKIPDEDEPGETIEVCNLSWGADPEQYVEQFRAELAKLAAISAGAVVPEGWKLVPVEPVTGMSVAAALYVDKVGEGKATVNGIYRAMLAAAPEVPHG